MKIAKKVLKTIGVLLGFIVVIVLGYIIYLYASYHRIEDNKSLSVESHTETKQTLTTGKQYSAITYNIGFGAYTPDFSFFMDGGKLWMEENHLGQRARKVFLKQLKMQEI